MTDAWPMRRDRQSGLTLIEMLIVLVIIGIAASAAVLSVNMIGRDRRAEEEAVRLVAHLEMAVDEGLVSRTPLALFWTAGSYGFKRQIADGWQAAETPRLVVDHALPSVLVLRRMDGMTEPVVVAEDGLGAPVNLEISGTGVPWVVAFNGFSATAKPGLAP